MIIDLILDRKDYIEIDNVDTFNPKDFYFNVMQYGKVGHDIARAMDHGTEEQVKSSLYNYLVSEGYNLEIKKFIDSVTWLRKGK